MSYVPIESYTKTDCQDGYLRQTFAFSGSFFCQADVFLYTPL